MIQIVNFGETVRQLEACLKTAKGAPTLRLPIILPAEADLNQLKSFLEELLELHDFYRSFLFSALLSGEPLSEEMRKAIEEAKIDLTEKEKAEPEVTRSGCVSLGTLRSFEKRSGEGP